MNNYPFMNEILNKLLTDSFSIFCGAGATADCTHKKWEDIFSEKTKKFYKYEFSNDIYFLAELEKRYWNQKDFFENIISKLTPLEDKESDHINAIIDLNLNQIWTTNFDELIEKRIQKVYKKKPTVITCSKDLLTCNLNEKYIVYKLNGSVTDQKTMILSASDYYDYFKKQRPLFESLKRQLVLDSFLFIGYSFQDKLVLSALREIKEVFSEDGNTHYRFRVLNNNLSKKSKPDCTLAKKEYLDYEKKYFLDEYKIQTIDIDKFEDIDFYLKELYRCFCNFNVLICGSYRSIDNNQRCYLEKLTGAIISKLYENDFNIYSGNGRGLGEIVVAQTARYAKKTNNRFVNQPLIFMGDDPLTKQEKNKLILKDCSTMIILCGQDDSLAYSRNVVAQFNQFLDERHLIIPVPSTGYAAKVIYELEEFKNSFTYRLEHDAIDKIALSEDIDYLANEIVNLILRYRKEMNSFS